MEDHQNPQATTIKQPQFKPKTLKAISLVEDYGEDPRYALELVKNKKVSAQSVSVFKNKLEKYRLTTPKIVKLAHNAIKDCLEDKAINGTEIKPTWSNKMSASALVMDRFHPVIHQQVNINAEFSPVDLSAYFNGAKPEPVKLGDIDV